MTPLRVRVYYEDTDASGVAYHASYLRWLERGRTEWLRELGFDQERLMRDEQAAFTLASLNIRYLRPARLDDELAVITRVARRARASIEFDQEIQYVSQDATLATASVRVGCVGVPAFRPRRIPEAILQGLADVG